MELELYGPDDKFYCKLDQDDALLGSYPVDDSCRIHVIDHSGLLLLLLSHFSHVRFCATT
uniref:Ubiquitin-like domain-containing protein n=1 Tax=Bos indicus x Bos taurus TaxID=30522 RepID=A0A4W2FK87_BOBOX